MGEIKVRLLPPELDYLVLKVNNNRPVLLRSNDKLSLCLDDQICLEEIQTNLYSRSGIHLHVNGHQVRRGESMQINELGVTRHNRLDVRKGLLVLGEVFIDTIGHN